MAACAHSGNHVAVFQRGEEARDISGVVLSVAVKGYEDFAGRPLHAKEECSGLTVIR